MQRCFHLPMSKNSPEEFGEVLRARDRRQDFSGRK
jgi:hypothetical protein